jgi:hypothetical protein
MQDRAAREAAEAAPEEDAALADAAASAPALATLRNRILEAFRALVMNSPKLIGETVEELALDTRGRGATTQEALHHRATRQRAFDTLKASFITETDGTHDAAVIAKTRAQLATMEADYRKHLQASGDLTGLAKASKAAKAATRAATQTAEVARAAQAFSPVGRPTVARVTAAVTLHTVAGGATARARTATPGTTAPATPGHTEGAGAGAGDGTAQVGTGVGVSPHPNSPRRQ